MAVAEELASMTIRDRLIFSQAVYEFGAGSAGWTQISKLLSQHPLVKHLKSILSTQV
jgi:bromodomain-containing protein 8